MKTIIGAIVGVGILAILIFIGWQVYNKTRVKETSSSTVIEQIKKVAKLQTIEMSTHSILQKSRKDWATATSYYSIVAVGTVTASIDLEKMEIKLDKDKNLVTIKLPGKVEVSNPTHDEFKVICDYSNFPTAPKFSAEEKAKYTNEAFGIIKKKALEKGIEKMAIEHAKEFLTIFINALGIEVQFL